MKNRNRRHEKRVVRNQNSRGWPVFAVAWRDGIGEASRLRLNECDDILSENSELETSWPTREKELTKIG